MTPRKRSERLRNRSQPERLETTVPPTTSRPRRGRPNSRPTEILIVDMPTVAAPTPEMGLPQTTAEQERIIADRLAIAMTNTGSANARNPVTSRNSRPRISF